MASLHVPRTAIRSISRTTLQFRSTATRIATRCLHQKTSPITASPLQHRPKIQQWSQNAAPMVASVARRTMFIQTEPTPNADVCALQTLRKDPANIYRLSNSTPTSVFSPSRYHRLSSSTSTPVPHSPRHIPHHLLRSFSTLME
jgi:hypothetical protein